MGGEGLLLSWAREVPIQTALNSRHAFPQVTHVTPQFSDCLSE